MTPELDTSTIQAGELSGLERELYSEIDVSPEKRSFWGKAGEVAKDILNVYYKPKEIEKKGKGRIYRGLGVHLFKKIVPTGGDYIHRLLHWKMPPYSLEHSIKNSSDRISGLKSYAIATCAYETLHLAFMASSVPGLVESIQEGDIGKTLHTIGWNVAVNIYPIMLQRYNRARIHNVLDNVQEKTPVR